MELTDRLLQCATHVLPYFSNQVLSIISLLGKTFMLEMFQVKSTAFCEYLVVKVLPHYYQLPDLPGLDTRYSV